LKLSVDAVSMLLDLLKEENTGSISLKKLLNSWETSNLKIS